MIADIHLLCEPNTIVPSQFFATLRRQAPTKQGEFRLLVAVLEDAINCFRRNARTADKSKQRLFDEARAWITGEDGDTVGHAADHAPGFSFEYVCDILGLDAADLRSGLRRWRTRNSPTAPRRPTARSHRRRAPAKAVPSWQGNSLRRQ